MFHNTIVYHPQLYTFRHIVPIRLYKRIRVGTRLSQAFSFRAKRCQCPWSLVAVVAIITPTMVKTGYAATYLLFLVRWLPTLCNGGTSDVYTSAILFHIEKEK